MFVFVLLTQAQERLVIGKVTAFDEYPLQKVSIILRDSKIEHYSDSTGYFRFRCGENEKIIFRANGFITKKVKIDNYAYNDTMHIDLEFKKGEKNFEYATGYDHIGKEQLATAIEHFEANTNYSGYNSILDIIQSRVTGVTLTGHSINIRGTTVLEGGDVDALLVVDGVVVEYPVFVNISPIQIKSIDVLKGGAASARYGSRGMGGVVVVKTKNGN